jgi:polyisoprenoid-binding protein YceI
MTYLVVATLRGSLGSIEGAMILDEDDPGRSAVTASIDVATLNTGSRLRDAHLRSSDFFHAERFPKATFRSARVETIDARNFRVVGDLTIRYMTKEVALDTVYDGQIPDANGSRRARFTATTILSRREFALGKRAPIETAGLIAGDRVTVTLDISAVAV